MIYFIFTAKFKTPSGDSPPRATRAQHELKLQAVVYKYNEEAEDDQLPIVIWHGINDNFANLDKFIKKLQVLTKRRVYPIKLTNSFIFDSFLSNFVPLFQTSMACMWLKENEDKFLKGYDAIGLSQGGLFFRTLSQTCIDVPKINNLLTIGAPHRGIAKVPHCKICDIIIDIFNISDNVYETDIICQIISVFSYWHNVKFEDLYRRKTFSGFMNHFGPNVNFKRLIMVQFLNDSVVEPRQSECFEYYELKNGYENTIQPFVQSDIYVKDTIGLKNLYDSNNMICIKVRGDHLQIDPLSISEIIKKYF
ncbi:hypothetical protein A3Q56_00104 [Intoshia linei]|uniref:Palmitoyl-protein thioesterase 1 n=1 Tax=Intoshia linei TaxID=1819745 RepID=A0A177BCT7_9BILA|nr:hypothetical protein A3Q56_00104 [Intoshia linei]